MAEGPRRALLWLAAATSMGVLVWIGASELRWPARAMTTFLVAVLPLLVAGQMGMADEVPEDLPRPLLYRTSSLALWILAALAALAGSASDLGMSELGLRPLPLLPFALWTAVALAGGLGMLFAARGLGVRETPLLRWLLPRTRAERLEFVGVSITAGVTEELVFRGFLITALGSAAGGLVLATVVSSFLFGFVHGYQGPAGTVRAGLLGLLLAIPFLATGSLLPSMAAHTALDLLAGIWLADRLTSGPAEPPET